MNDPATNGGWHQPVQDDTIMQVINAPVKPVQDRLERLSAKTTANPFDTDAWKQYLKEALDRGDPVTVRTAYEALLAQYPTSSNYWISYAEYEQKQKEFDRVEQIFARCLRTVATVDLYKFYLHYIQKTHSTASSDPAEAYTTIGNAFEYVISNIGFDLHSAPIWDEYISFVKAGTTTSTYEEQQKMDKLRRVYQQAILIPISNIEQIWRDYDTFENSLNKLTAKKFMSERSAGYMTARSALRELKSLKEPIEKILSNKHLAATPPRWSEGDCKLLAYWKRYIDWEQGNPLCIDDPGTLMARILFAYKECLLVMRFYPEIWVDAADYLNREGRHDEAEQFLVDGIDAMPTSLLISFTLAECYESRKKEYKEICRVFETLIGALEEEVVRVNEKYDAQRESLLAKLESGVETREQQLSEQQQQQQPTDEADWDGETRERERERARDISGQVEEAVEAKRRGRLEVLKAAITTAFIDYMRVARRESEKAARQVFGLARKSPNITYQVCVYSALMEYHCSKDSAIAGRVFEHSLKTFQADYPQATQIVLEYLSFLYNINDETNARAVFERAVTSIPVDYQSPIWKRVLQYETSFGEYGLIRNVEKRYAECLEMMTSTSTATAVIDSVGVIQSTSDRFSFLGLSYIADRELGLQAMRQYSDKLPKLLPKTSSSSRIGARLPNNTNSATSRSKLSQTLDSVHADRYPRPDFGRWAVFKADPSLMVEATSGPTPDTTTTTQQQQQQQQQHSSSTTDTQSIHTSPPQPQSANGFLVPPAVAAFMKKLPAPHDFPGPYVGVDEVMLLIGQLPVPVPGTPLVWVTVEMPVVVVQQYEYFEQRERRRDERGRPYDRQEYGGARRSGGGGGGRRR